MTRSTLRRSMTLESLEKREVLSAAPSANTQYALELINLARTQPAAAAAWISSHVDANDTATFKAYGVNLSQELSEISSAAPQPALAWNDTLAQTAVNQSSDQAIHNFQGHNSSDGTTFTERLSNAGYQSTSSGEDAFAYANSVDHVIKAFLIDWGVADKGHRRNIQQPGVSQNDAYREVGIGIVATGTQANTPNHVGPYVITMDFGSRAGAQAQLLGVDYNDSNNDGMYTPGEGKGGVEIDALNLATNQLTKTTTSAAGGYQMALAPGTYQVSDVDKNGNALSTQTVTIGSVNVKVDFVNHPDQAPASAPKPVVVATVQTTKTAAITTSVAAPVTQVKVATVPAKPTLAAIQSANQLESLVNSWVAFRGGVRLS